MSEKFKISNLDLYYGDFSCVERYQYEYPCQRDHSFHRTIRLWKIDLFKKSEQNE